MTETSAIRNNKENNIILTNSITLLEHGILEQQQK